MDSPHSQLCNIGGREVSKRRWVAVATLVLSVAIETGFVVAEASRWWRLALLPLIYIAILGFLQAHTKVCVRNAISGIRNMGDGNQVVEVDSERNALRGRGLTIIAQAATGALVITAIIILMHD